MIVVPLKIKLISSLAVGTLIFVINLLWLPSTLMRTEELIMPKMVVFSSDDWGRWTDVIPLWPNLEYQEEFIRNGGSFPPKLMNWIYGTVETEQDIKKFFDLINDLNKDVRFEHRVVITPFWVVGGPDYQSMRSKSKSQDRANRLFLLNHHFDALSITLFIIRLLISDQKRMDVLIIVVHVNMKNYLSIRAQLECQNHLSRK